MYIDCLCIDKRDRPKSLLLIRVHACVDSVLLKCKQNFVKNTYNSLKNVNIVKTNDIKHRQCSYPSKRFQDYFFIQHLTNSTYSFRKYISQKNTLKLNCIQAYRALQDTTSLKF